jgi:hypothetical protein
MSLGVSHAQLTATIDDYPISLKQATKGTMELHYGLFQRQYYFFVKTGNSQLIALSREVNDSDYYKSKLSQLTNGFGNTEALTYELKSLKKYINDYNASSNPSFTPYEEPKRLSWYGTLFTGVTNNPFVTNTDNSLNPMAGLEVEMSGNVPTPRHSGFFQYRYAFATKDFDYQTQEFAVGYRYRFVRKNWGALFAQVKAATLNVSRALISTEDNTSLEVNNTSFDAAFIFGLGADFKIGERSYITFIYGELFAFFLENEGNFPLDFALGYKWRF